MLSSTPSTTAFRGIPIAVLCVALLSACGGKAYQRGDPDALDFRSRAETQADGPIRVSAAVLGTDETRSIFGIDLYRQGIQPVWLEIENAGNLRARYAPVGTDSNYFSPMEVAYKNRGGYSDKGRSDMEQHFDRHAMPRYIGPGETRSGFVFTHADSGAKGFNVDVFSLDEAWTFTFLLRVPGFVPDYANLDFDTIYAPDDISVYHGAELRDAIRNLPCCTSDADGTRAGGAVNIVLVGLGREFLPALLRSRWVETSQSEATDKEPAYLFGRHQDAIFRYQSFKDDSVYELRLWLAPLMHGKDRVWVGQVRHFFGLRGAFGRFDPDVDAARGFALQNLLYGEALAQVAWVAGDALYPVENFWQNLIGNPFFTDGIRAVLWLSPEPYSLVDLSILEWDQPPGSRR